MAKIHKRNKDKKVNNPVSNREARRRNKVLNGQHKSHVTTESKESKLATHDAASQYYQLYLRHTGSQKAFKVWLSKVIDADEKTALKWGKIERVLHYFKMLFKALGGRL